MSIPRLLIVLAVTASPLAAQATLSQSFVPRDSRERTITITAVPFPGRTFELKSGGVLNGHFDAAHSCLSLTICDSFGAQAAKQDEGFRLFESKPLATGEEADLIILPQEALVYAHALAENATPCYAMRSYGFTPTDPKTGLTKPTGVTICSPAAVFVSRT